MNLGDVPSRSRFVHPQEYAKDESGRDSDLENELAEPREARWIPGGERLVEIKNEASTGDSPVLASPHFEVDEGHDEHRQPNIPTRSQ